MINWKKVDYNFLHKIVNTEQSFVFINIFRESDKVIVAGQVMFCPPKHVYQFKIVNSWYGDDGELFGIDGDGTWFYAESDEFFAVIEGVK